MRRGIAIAAFVVVLAAVPAFCQRHGGMSASSAGRGGSVSHGPVFGGRGGIVVGSFHSGMRFRTGFPGRFSHRRFFNSYSPYPYYAGYGYPLFYDPPDSPSPYDAAAPYYQLNQQQTNEINRLSDEVERLRDEQESRRSEQVPPPQASNRQSAPELPTVLVFRDGHKQEVVNYAIVGQTLWILGEDKATKVSVADLDVPATTKVNDEHGVDFRLPQ